MPLSGGTNTDFGQAGHGIRREKRLEFYDGDGQYVVGGLMRFANMSLDDAVDSVRASGGEVEQNYVDAVRASLEKAGRRE